MAVRFADHDGDVLVPGDDFRLGVRIADESIAEFVQNEPGEFGGRFRGKVEGETEAVSSLLHGAVGSRSLRHRRFNGLCRGGR